MKKGLNERKPNIIFILADDLGAWAMRCAGNTDIRTPNLDRLARQGMRFTNCFCASPVCSPARASILTGIIPSAHGVHDWLRGGNLDRDLPQAGNQARYANEHKAIQYLANLTTYTDLLAENDYTCALSGKWHLGDSLAPQHGFSRWLTIGGGGCPYYHPDVVRNGDICFETRYLTDIIAEDALENIHELSQKGNPFYLSIHFTAPHSPWDAANHPREMLDLYQDCAFTATPDLEIHPWQVASAPFGTGEVRKELLRGYYAAVTSMDRSIGLILDALEARGIRDNTLILFTSDNGMNMGHHGIWGKGNGTFPLNMFDTSVKVPCLVSLPGAIAQDCICDQLVSHYDIFPTLREYLGLTGDVPQILPGKSFADILDGKNATDSVSGSVIVLDEYGPVRMIRSREWKYVHRYPYGPNELYNIGQDPDELQNLVDHPEFLPIQQGLKAELDNWFCKYADPGLDGSREGVTGFGQLRRCGIYAEGKKIYYGNAACTLIKVT